MRKIERERQRNRQRQCTDLIKTFYTKLESSDPLLLAPRERKRERERERERIEIKRSNILIFDFSNFTIDEEN